MCMSYYIAVDYDGCGHRINFVDSFNWCDNAVDHLTVCRTVGYRILYTESFSGNCEHCS